MVVSISDQSANGNRKLAMLYRIFVICCQKNLPNLANGVKTVLSPLASVLAGKPSSCQD